MAHVVEAARAGDALALGLLDDEAMRLGPRFTTLLHLYRPERLVWGAALPRR